MAAASVHTTEKLVITWEQFHRDARALAALLRSLGPFSTLVAVTRGGLAPVAIVASELDLRRIETVSIASYVAEWVRGEGRVIKPVAPEFARPDTSGKLLVIDDLADSGETLRIVREILPAAHVATLYVKPLGKALVDTFVREVPQATWIGFPWDRVSPNDVSDNERFSS